MRRGRGVALSAQGTDTVVPRQVEGPQARPDPIKPKGEPPVYDDVRYSDSRRNRSPELWAPRSRHAGARARPALRDPIVKEIPNRAWRRWVTDGLVRMVVRVQRRYTRAEPGELPMLVGDLSRPKGGNFGVTFGLVGHSSHQNALDVDVYYPRRDGRRGVPRMPAAVDVRLAQRLADLFAAAGAETVLVGPNVALKGPPDVVKPYPNHDNHLHVRIQNPDASEPLSRMGVR